MPYAINAIGSRAFAAWLLSIAALLAVFSPEAAAQETHATVRLDGRAVFRVGELPNQDARTRARQIEQRLLAVLENPRALARARVTGVNGQPMQRQIMVSGRPIVMVTPVDAEENGTTVDALAAQWAQAIDGALQRAGARRSSERERFVTAVRAGVETAFARLLDSAILIIPRALAALFVIGLFWIAAVTFRWALKVTSGWVLSDPTARNLVQQVGYYTVWILGLVVAASAFGMDPQSVATGLGLTSLALGFALKDILSNFVSGILILTLRPFRLGDQIVIGETEGNVERIELRATIIRTYDGRVVSVPNSETFTSRVTNNTASPIRRGTVEAYLGYDIDLRQAAIAMCEAARGAEGVLPEPDTEVRIRQLGHDDVLVEVRFWADSRRSDFISTASRVREAVVDHFKKNAIGLPDPRVRIVLNQQ